MTKTSGFKDFSDLPTGNVKDKNGVVHVLEYAGHHIIPQTTYENSSFLQALGAAGLWKEYDFATNGVPLVAKIDGNTASHSEFRDLVGGSLHTGGHKSYRTALGEILANFDEAYKNQD